MLSIIFIIVFCRNVRYLVVYGLFFWLIYKNKCVVIFVLIVSFCRFEVINRIVVVLKMIIIMFGVGYKNVIIFYEIIGYISCCFIIGLCCFVLMRLCCYVVIRLCSNIVEDYVIYVFLFLIILFFLRMLYNGKM